MLNCYLVYVVFNSDFFYLPFPFYRLNLKVLLLSIENHAKEWKQILGNHLLSDTIRGMNELSVQIQDLRVEVELVIIGLERFMSIMQAITDIKSMAVRIELQFISYQECFKTMRAHNIPFSAEDEARAYDLQNDWESLYLGALYRASTLESTKETFAELTQDEIHQFLEELAKFARDFEEHGPGSIGDNLDEGVKKMEVKGN